jgi:hypothetical protein
MISGLELGGGANMLEIITMLSVVAMIFCVAIVFVALVAGGLFKASRAMRKKATQEIS